MSSKTPRLEKAIKFAQKDMTSLRLKKMMTKGFLFIFITYFFIFYFLKLKTDSNAINEP